jgi:hypothetical protein
MPVRSIVDGLSDEAAHVLIDNMQLATMLQELHDSRYMWYGEDTPSALDDDAPTQGWEARLFKALRDIATEHQLSIDELVEAVMWATDHHCGR